MSVPFYQQMQSNITSVITNPNGYKFDLKTGGHILGLISQAYWTYEIFIRSSEYYLQLLLPFTVFYSWLAVGWFNRFAKKNKLMVSEVIAAMFWIFLYCVPIITLIRLLAGEEYFNQIIKSIVRSLSFFALIGIVTNRWQINLFVFWILVAILSAIHFVWSLNSISPMDFDYSQK